VLRNADRSEPIDLAVAVNGKVWATTRSFLGGEEHHFSVIVPESHFRNGNNQLDVFEIVDGGATLAHLSRKTLDGTLSLINTPEFEALRTPQGFVVPIRSDGLHGYLETVELAAGSLRLRGWALDGDLGPPTQFAVFAGSQFLSAGPPLARRPDLVKVLKAPAPAIAGIESFFPVPERAGNDPSTIRVFALWDYALAYELPRLPAPAATGP
jgi:hypothetical protein